MEKIHIYGLPNCDTTRAALKWLKNNKTEFEFHDYKVAGISKAKLEEWSKQVGWEILLNKKSTTWRGLTATEQAGATNQQEAIKMMMKNNSIIKRPVVETGNKLIVGFNEEIFSKQIKQSK